MKKSIVVLLLLALLLLFTCAGAQTPDCTHQWRAFVLNEDWTHLMQSWDFEEEDDLHHIKRYVVPQEICDLCGALSEEGQICGAQEPHAFIVNDYMHNEDTSEVHIRLSCRICGYEKDIISSQLMFLDDAEKDCLLGGECDPNHSAYMNEAGELVWGSAGANGADHQFFVGVVHDEDRYLLYSREYCIRCGRPKAVLLETAQGVPDERWEHVEIMTMEAFLSEGLPMNLPFRLVDEIQK